MKSVISLDTEYEGGKPFLASSNDGRATRLYVLEQKKDFAALKALAENDHVVKVYHNAPADMYVMSNVGIQHRGPFEDTMLCSSLVDEQYDSVNLKALARVHLGASTESETALKNLINKTKRWCKAMHQKKCTPDCAKHGGGIEFSWGLLYRLHPKEMKAYAGDDAVLTRRLYVEKFQQAVKRFQGAYEFEKSVVPVVVRMMQNGIEIDRRYVLKKLRMHQQAMARIQRSVVRWVAARGVRVPELNLQSGEQISDVILALRARESSISPLWRKGVGLKDHRVVETEWVRTKKGGLSTEADELLPRRDHEVIAKVLEFRFHKTQVKYYKALGLVYTSPQNSVAHFEYYQTGTSTSRFTAQYIQTIPRPEESHKAGEGKKHEVRMAFVPGKRQKFLTLDAAQEELRVFAHYSKCSGLMSLFKRGIDPYVGTAEDIFGKEVVHQSKNLFKVTRKIGKDCSLSGIYYIGKEKLLFAMMHKVGEMMDRETAKVLDLTMARATAVYNRFHILYPEVKQWNKERIQEVKRTGEVVVSLQSPLMEFFRVFRIPEELAYKGGNAIVQGTCAAVLKAMMLRTTQWLKQERLEKSVQMRASVHDELVFTYPEMSKTHERDLILNLRAQAEDRSTFRVPILVEAKISGRSWGEVEKYDAN